MMPKLRPSAILFAFIALTSVTAQTFQYSRGWTNGKRDGHRRVDTDLREIAGNLERTLTPCQLNKLKYVLEGKPLSERIFSPCEYTEEESDSQPKRHYKSDHNQEPLFETFL
ncbi:hypothetical protein JYU34_019185 [Plutella xylostella]|uniref:Pro-corazonin n=1 Tax=Plutella xylostella TaxID=51655 RepID=A0ABQ7PWG9_PLUXY|nr:pro-corazonin [Plutella xylostella]XP_037967642.2 pro-corazonin [Plutella xylostella]KAG7297245.1 hypothetical protein JYU34_019185 [Plutella xylostella]